ncbi:MAG: ComF family protein, partial [Deltaproteobacteria bacterium]|nr:ComF family protein [Deltaproteobacteria bacterium]
LLYQLKYKQEQNVIADLVEVAINFINNNWKDIIDAIIPIPPSRTPRKFQPVLEIAKGISAGIRIPCFDNILVKVKEKPELKNVFDFHERLAILTNNFIVNDNLSGLKQILLFDDLFRSGATLNAATEALSNKGIVEKVYVLTLTRTRILS